MDDGFSGTGQFDTVGIIGVGLIGGSLGLALKEKGLARRVLGCARRESTLQTALEVGAIDAGTHDPVEASEGADFVVLATPVGDIVPTFKRILPGLRDCALVTDVGSTKADIVRAANAVTLQAGTSAVFVGSHPMAGSEKTGPGAARATLFEGATWVITPTDRTDADAVLLLTQLVERVGGRPFLLDPDTHDQIVAYTSHLPHLLSSALTHVVFEKNEEQPVTSRMTASGFRDTTRLAEGAANLWRDICATNQANLIDAIDSLVHQLSLVRSTLAEGDVARLADWLQQAAAGRARLLNT